MPFVIAALVVSLVAVAVLAAVALRERRRVAAASEELARRTEDAARAEADLRRFASVAAHDLAEPLRTIGGFAALLASRYEGRLDASADDFLRHIVDGTRRMQHLLDGLSAYARAERDTTAHEPVELGPVVRRVVRDLDTLIEESHATVLVDDLPTVCGDRVQLEQLFQNLLANALKFHGGEPPYVEVAAERNGCGWCVTVADRGPGVPEEERETVFAMFARGGAGGGEAARPPGGGIGLAVCAKVVANHGGRIWVEPNPGGGSAFRFTLPGEAAS